jgi:hypothetical protein
MEKIKILKRKEKKAPDAGVKSKSKSKVKDQSKTSFRTLMNAPAPPSSLISLTRASVCWYSRSRAAEEDFPRETGR